MISRNSFVVLSFRFIFIFANWNFLVLGGILFEVERAKVILCPEHSVESSTEKDVKLDEAG